MKKLTLLFLFSISALTLQARTVDVSASYAGGTHLDKTHVAATMALTLNTLAGIEAGAVNPRYIKDTIYSLAVPVALDLGTVGFTLRPFYYFKNKSDNPLFQDANAYGLNAQLRMTLNDDRVENIYTHAVMGVSYGRQKGTAFYQDGSFENRYYSQMAYTFGISQILYNAFGFEVDGAVFQYPDGISEVAGFRGVLDQQDLARLLTLDFVQALPKYSVGARATRMWAENGSTLYLSYRYGEFHTARPEHSIMFGNTFPIGDRILVDVTYNHVREVKDKNRRDIGSLRLNVSF